MALATPRLTTDMTVAHNRASKSAEAKENQPTVSVQVQNCNFIKEQSMQSKLNI